MKWLVWLAVFTMSIPSAMAHGGEEETTLFVEAHDDDGFYFLVEGYDGKNPTIVLAPGQTYVVQFTNLGSMPHNFRVAELAVFGTPLINPGESATLEFLVPTSGFDAYWCDPHRSSGMTGQVVANSDDLEKESPGFAFLGTIFVLGAVMMNRRRI